MIDTDARDRWFLGTRIRMLVTGEDSGGRATVAEQRAPRGFSPPLHVHETEDTVFYVLAGRVTVRLGDDTLALEAGQAGFLPRGVPHTFRVDSDEAQLIEVTTPGGFDRFVMENSEPATAPGLPPGPPSIDPARLGASAAKHGAPLVGPPLAPAA